MAAGRKRSFEDNCVPKPEFGNEEIADPIAVAIVEGL